jgi:hypothetical protein
MPKDADIESQIEKSLASYVDTNETRRERVEYRGVPIDLPVIRVNPALLLFNGQNSRVRAQLLDHPKRSEVEADPLSAMAQSLIEELLRKTEEYPKLKDQLKEMDQIKPGIISRHGILVNGNTRVAALRELGSQGVDVAVLPATATAQDFVDIEMSLQMTSLIKQDYTFTNELLMMESYLRDGHTSLQLANILGWSKNKEKRIEKSLRILAIINEVRNMAQPVLPYSVFDSKKELISNLDDEYQRLKAQGDPIAAEDMKWNRIFAMLMGASKDQVREVDEGFLDEEVRERLESGELGANLITKHVTKAAKSAFGGMITERVDSKKIVEDLLTNKEMRNGADDLVIDGPSPYAAIQRAIRTAAAAKVQDKILKDYKLNPSEMIAERRRDLRALLEKIDEIFSSSGFNQSKFEFELGELESVVADIATKFEAQFGKQNM